MRMRGGGGVGDEDDSDEGRKGMWEKGMMGCGEGNWDG